MAIILYTLDNGNTPNYITDGGHFLNDTDDSRIGIGSGGGTELSIAELITRQQTMTHYYREYVGQATDKPSGTGLYVEGSARNMTNAEIEEMVNIWCTGKGLM